MSGMTLGAGLGAVAFWAFLAAVVVAGIWYDIRKREAQHETLRRVIESGQTLDHALMDKLLSLGGGGRRVERDLMIGGMIVLLTAPGLALLAWLVGQISDRALYPILGAAALVACVGIGLLAAAMVVGRWYREDEGAVPSFRDRP